MNIFIPAVNKNKVVIFEAQTLLIPSGNGTCFVTGFVDNVITEIVQQAVSYFRYNLKRYNISEKKFTDFDIHVHFTEGSFFKEGSSAGLGIFLSVANQLLGYNKTELKILATGELDLFGNTINVGGISLKTNFFKNNQLIDYFFLPPNNIDVFQQKIFQIRHFDEIINFLVNKVIK